MPPRPDTEYRSKCSKPQGFHTSMRIGHLGNVALHEYIGVYHHVSFVFKLRRTMAGRFRRLRALWTKK